MKKIESKSLSHKRFFRFLQHCSFREGRWEGTAGMTERHLNSLTSIKKPYYRATLPEHSLHDASNFWMEGIRCSRVYTTTLSMAYCISWPRILPFIPVLFCPACHLSQGLQSMSAASSILPVLKIHNSGSKYWSRSPWAEKGQQTQTEEPWR